MRIKQNKLTEKPDLEYTKNGTLVQIYSKPCYCVNIVNETSRHCYPLTHEQYEIYMLGKDPRKQAEKIGKVVMA